MLRFTQTSKIVLGGVAALVYCWVFARIYSGPSSPSTSLARITPSHLPRSHTPPVLEPPKSYTCVKIDHLLDLNGHGNDPAWDQAAWTGDFVDIQGNSLPTPRYRTRAKMLWNQQYLYVYAQLQEPQVWGTITQKNAVIFHDNDFEVFMDPDATGENYYEFEMNALNTIWELTLPKRYSRGGKPILGTNLAGLVSSVAVEGTLNNPNDIDRGWSVEIAFPFAGLAAHRRLGACPPMTGDIWRINFSRVEWAVDVVEGKYRKLKKPEDNWVWTPQGVIDMHQPEHWGCLKFDR